MSFKIFAFIVTMNIITGCAQFTPLDGSYLANVDEAQAWDNTLDDPRDGVSSEVPRSEKLLSNELHRLESIQSEEDLDFYQEYQHKLKTVSERIFFLKLSPFDRQDYLASRGFLSAREEVALRGPAQYFKLRKNEVAFGMQKPDVLDSLGKPLRVEVAGNPRHENERWLYQFNGAPKYIYFESGEVQGWE